MLESNSTFEEMAIQEQKGLRPSGNIENRQFSMQEVTEANNHPVGPQDPVKLEVASNEDITPEVISDQDIREKLKDPKFLPTEAQVRQAFPRTGETEGINMEWKKFCGENNIYQLVTKELIEDLTTQIIQEINEMLSSHDLQASPVTIVELGAGDGRLSHFLREELKSRNLNSAVQVVATDNQSWKSEGKIAETEFAVEQLSADEAVDKYTQNGRTILLSSWMPPNANWTAQYLQKNNVNGMMLIGDVDSTGTGYETWFPDDYPTKRLTDDIRGNFGRAQDSPNSTYGQPEVVFISKE